MTHDEVNVFPDTLANIEKARSLSHRRFDDRMVQYRNIGLLLSSRAAEMPDKNWLTFYDESGAATQRMTYAEFEDAARRTASLMADRLGVRTGDRIATLMINDPRTVLIYFAAWLLGA